MRTARRAFVGALGFFLAGCASLPQRLAAPEVQVTSVRVVRIALPAVEMEIALALTNPNPVGVAIAAIDATLAIEGDKVADVALRSPATLVAEATTPVLLDARTDFSTTLGVARRAMAAGLPALRYELAGSVVQGDGRRWPFTRRGEFSASTLARIRP
jgi:LEA14-like dessication related protein